MFKKIHFASIFKRNFKKTSNEISGAILKNFQPAQIEHNVLNLKYKYKYIIGLQWRLKFVR